MRASAFLIQPPLSLFLYFFYFIESEFFPAINTGASLGGLIPGVSAFEVARPEGPCSALVGPHRINSASFRPANILEKNAVPGTGPLDNRRTQANPLEILLPQLVGCNTEKISN